MSDVSGIPYMGPMGMGNMFASPYPALTGGGNMSAGQISQPYMPEVNYNQNVVNNLWSSGGGFGQLTNYYSQLGANQLSGLTPYTFDQRNAGTGQTMAQLYGGGGASPYQTTPNVFDTGASGFAYPGAGSINWNMFQQPASPYQTSPNVFSQGASPFNYSGAGLDWSGMYQPPRSSDPYPGMSMPGGLNSPMSTAQTPAFDWFGMGGGSSSARADPFPGMSMPGGLGSPMTTRQPDFNTLFPERSGGLGTSSQSPFDTGTSPTAALYAPPSGAGGVAAGGLDWGGMMGAPYQSPATPNQYPSGGAPVTEPYNPYFSVASPYTGRAGGEVTGGDGIGSAEPRVYDLAPMFEAGGGGGFGAGGGDTSGTGDANAGALSGNAFSYNPEPGGTQDIFSQPAGALAEKARENLAGLMGGSRGAEVDPAKEASVPEPAAPAAELSDERISGAGFNALDAAAPPSGVEKAQAFLKRSVESILKQYSPENLGKAGFVLDLKQPMREALKGPWGGQILSGLQPKLGSLGLTPADFSKAVADPRARFAGGGDFGPYPAYAGPEAAPGGSGGWSLPTPSSLHPDITDERGPFVNTMSQSLLGYTPQQWPASAYPPISSTDSGYSPAIFGGGRDPNAQIDINQAYGFPGAPGAAAPEATMEGPPSPLGVSPDIAKYYMQEPQVNARTQDVFNAFPGPFDIYQQQQQLQDARAEIMQQLEADPAAMLRMAAIANTEMRQGGGQLGDNERKMLIESAFNRFGARPELAFSGSDMSLSSPLNPPGTRGAYYAPARPAGAPGGTATLGPMEARLQRDPALLAQLTDLVRQVGYGGTNLSGIAMENASGGLAGRSAQTQSLADFAPYTQESFLRKDVPGTERLHGPVGAYSNFNYQNSPWQNFSADYAGSNPARNIPWQQLWGR